MNDWKRLDEHIPEHNIWYFVKYKTTHTEDVGIGVYDEVANDFLMVNSADEHANSSPYYLDYHMTVTAWQPIKYPKL